MARLSDLKFSYRAYMKAYRYRQFDWGPGNLLHLPLSRARLALITTAAYYLPEQPPFDSGKKGGDCSYRILPAEADLSRLKIAHKSDAFDASGMEVDKNVALPLDRVRSLVAAGRLGSISPRHYSFMGSISNPDDLVGRTAPEVAAMLREDEVDAVFLTPV